MSHLRKSAPSTDTCVKTRLALRQKRHRIHASNGACVNCCTICINIFKPASFRDLNSQCSMLLTTFITTEHVVCDISSQTLGHLLDRALAQASAKSSAVMFAHARCRQGGVFMLLYLRYDGYLQVAAWDDARPRLSAAANPSDVVILQLAHPQPKAQVCWCRERRFAAVIAKRE
jgi:hypothetical protein